MSTRSSPSSELLGALGGHADAALEAAARANGATRAQLSASWAQRACSEASTGEAFAAVLAALRRAGAATAVVELAERSVEDEARHAAICRALACAYAGGDVVVRPTLPARVPTYTGVTDPRGVAALHVSGMCAVNEALACVFVEACLRDATDDWLRDVHRAHLHDEIGHARVAFAHLASPAVDDRVRGLVAAWLPKILAANVTHWLSRIDTLPEQGVAGHAYPPRSALRDGVRRAVGELIVPGFAHVGVDTAPAEAWAATLAV